MNDSAPESVTADLRLSADVGVWRPKGGGIRNLTLTDAQRHRQLHPGTGRSQAVRC